ncbi:hypothetical protein FQP90_20205 [Paenarthrobacter nitroguajacolicus]|uniref:Uncharacterized protein n=1 Tax=Paenarthrobacter nitroguajacolicus TaxID=211146 RepID=A0A558GPS1_PAENT|nr:hypothetical protein [Paenarthrobacter nitroguajacolicus]TVU58861.1 hypothetical protein FQP90_20205 [Paenarthrobacter nitroguajacolicus]
MDLSLIARVTTSVHWRTAALAITGVLLLSGCQSGGNPAGSATTDRMSADPTSKYPELASGSIVSADGLYQLMPDFHCRDDGPDSKDAGCLTMECPATADGATEGRPVIWKRALRTIANPGWQDWIPVGGPTCFYDPHA